MNGQPVWLASLSTRNSKGSIIATGDLTADQRLDAEDTLREVMQGIGDVNRERLFRMNITMCLHRAATDAEVASAPEWWRDGMKCGMNGLAGGPVEILWENTPATDSCKPCVQPEKVLIHESRPDLWFPRDCGSCAPCLARAAC